MSEPTPDADREAILAHVRGLFDAYLRQDRAAIRAGHTADWTGFPVGARELVRGLDAYMEHAEDSLRRLRGTGYGITDWALEVLGDLALLYYRAEYRALDAEGRPLTLQLRSLDVYRREAGGWNQAGSHIGLAPAAGD